MKVGQWVRYKERKPYLTNNIKVGKILEVFETGVIIGEHGYVNRENDILKTADTLEELLEIGDIVHFERPYQNFEDTRIMHNDISISTIKDDVRFNDYKITAIELHENRVKQEVAHDE